MKNKILNIKNLSKSYGAFKVTDEIAIDLNFNEIHALIGPNGAGKSTLIKQIVGSVKHDIGSIILDQEDITDLTDIERAKIGISRTFQVSSIIPKFSVLENIILSLLNKSNNTFQLFKSLKQNRELYLKAKKILRDIKIPIQGGLDPKILLTDKETLKKEASYYLEIFKDHPYIFNLGHGILPETNPEMVENLIKTVRDFK